MPKYSLCTPMPGGSSYVIEYDDQRISVHLPPVGYTIDRIPDPETGIPSYELVKCEILFDNLPPDKQKWTRTNLPKEWEKWRAEEEAAKEDNPRFVHPKCDKFRRQEWARRINGVWMAIWDPIKKETEFVYLPGFGYFIHNWWRQDFGYPKFRFVYLKVYYALQLAEDHPKIHGVTMSTNRRFGKTSIAFGWQFEFCSRNFNAYGGMQAQIKSDAKEKWDTCMVFGWKRVPDFFTPKYDYNLSNEFKFIIPLTGSKHENKQVMDETQELGGFINFRETKSTSYDGKKLHRYVMEEPGKWETEDVYKTLRVIIPCTMDLGADRKIGLVFAPTTIEDLNSGGYEFIEMFEDSFPKLMEKNEDGKTTSGLLALFIPAYEGFLFDEYGRSIIDDPPPGVVVVNEKGEVQKNPIGSKRLILNSRKKFEKDRQKYAEQVRKFPFTWSEAKMMADQESPFNLEILMKRYNELAALPTNLFIKGNFAWKDGIIDGDVEFVRDDIGGRWAMGMLFDEIGGLYEDSSKITNRVGVDYRDGMTLYYPKNDRMFTIGTDPIRYGRSDDPRSSKASAYAFYKFDQNVDGLSMSAALERNTAKSHNFVAEYFYRPDEFKIYGEDMIMACRYFGCSICAEDTIESIRQHFDARGYGMFVMYKAMFSAEVLMKGEKEAWKGIKPDDEVIHKYVSYLITFVLKHGHRLIFPNLIKQMMEFTIKERTKYDAVVGAGFTLLGAEKTLVDYDSEEVRTITRHFPQYSQDGMRSQALADDNDYQYANTEIDDTQFDDD